MKRTLILIFSLTACASQFAGATTVGFGPVPAARTVVDSLGVTLGGSALILVGNFTSETFTFNPAISISANVTAITLAGGWAQFGLDTQTRTVNAGVTSSLAISTTAPLGKLSGTVADQNGGSTKADFFNTKNLYVWVFNAASVAASTQMGIFRATAATVPWVFPSNGNGVGDTLTYSTTSTAAPTMVAIGSVGATSSTQLQLVAAVPEPSVLALGGMAALGMLASRKRGMKK